jgi:P27 family predicted phage terminase small subunit
MSTAGVPPLPTKMKLLKGIRPDRINHNEPQAEPIKLQPPHHVIKEARKEWYRIVPMLDKMGVLGNVNTAALVVYCIAWARYMEVEKLIREGGMVTSSEKGVGIYVSTYIRISNECVRIMYRLLTEFGATPSSRSRIQAEPKREDGIDEHLDTDT